MRESRETRIGRLREELVRTQEKAAEWQARVRELEKQITEQENLEILQVVRSAVTSPEDLRGLLDMIRTAQKPSRNNSKEDN